MISNSEKSQIKILLQSPQWKVAERVAGELCDKISYNSKLRPTEWETLQTLLIQEGQVQGIKLFVKELYNEAQNS